MGRVDHEAFAKRVIHHLKYTAKDVKSLTVQHFQQEGKSRKTIYNIIRRYENSGQVEFARIPGRPVSVATDRIVNKVQRLYRTSPGVSNRAAAKALDLCTSTLRHIKRKRLGLKSYVKQKAPKYIKNQANRAKTGCRKVYMKTLKKILIMDDETYVPKDPENANIRRYYTSTSRTDLKYEDRIKPKEKFPKKYLIWQAIGEKGNISEPFVSENTMTKKVYIKECLKKRLLPFIRKHHNLNDILFWPDLATSHYAKETTCFLEENLVDYIKKKNNAPNAPQARGIERFWAICKERYSNSKNVPKSITGFKRMWTKISRQVATESGKVVMDSAARKLRKIGYHGVTGAE